MKISPCFKLNCCIHGDECDNQNEYWVAPCNCLHGVYDGNKIKVMYGYKLFKLIENDKTIDQELYDHLKEQYELERELVANNELYWSVKK